CAGPLPQHPPTIATPSPRNDRACSPKYSGVAGYTNLPPISCGPPAFGRATIGTLADPSTGRIARTTRNTCAGPSPQFTPTASAPSSTNRAATSSGFDPSSLRSSPANVEPTTTAILGAA